MSTNFLFPQPVTRGKREREPKQRVALEAELVAAHAREGVLLQKTHEMSQRQHMMAQEFEHRLINGLQLIASLLSLQSRSATPEASAQLSIAARRVAALGRVHHQLHTLDQVDRVNFKQYLQLLCDHLSGLLFQEGSGIVVEGADCEIPTILGIPLGFIVNELITNSAKYAKGNIIVRVEETSPACHALSILDDGPGLPTGFDPTKSNGLGMRIVLTLVKQIGGELLFSTGENGRGARFTVTFGHDQQTGRTDPRSDAGDHTASD